MLTLTPTPSVTNRLSFEQALQEIAEQVVSARKLALAAYDSAEIIEANGVQVRQAYGHLMRECPCCHQIGLVSVSPRTNGLQEALAYISRKQWQCRTCEINETEAQQQQVA